MYAVKQESEMGNTKILNNILVALLLLSSVFFVSCNHRESLPLPTTDSEKYNSIRDANDWQNPYLIVLRDGVAVICNALSKNERKTISVDELGDYLSKLPKTA